MSSIPAFLSRRRVLAGLGSALGTLALPLRSDAQKAPEPAEMADGFRVLRATSGTASLRGPGAGATDVWGFGGSVPGPTVRVRRGQELKLRVINDLPEPTAIHWHGVRIANAMDGTLLSQKAIAPGARFDYVFTPPDAGTFWYHPHLNASQQVDRGLYGVLIVEEPEPADVDREVVLVFDDWRLTPDGANDVASYGNPHDAAHEGRLGDVFTVNGLPALDIPVKINERLRLRLLNAATARMMAVRIEGHAATVMALDGQPAEPFAARDSRIILGPGNRADVFVDAMLQPGAGAAIGLDLPQGFRPLARLVYEPGAPARPSPRPAPKPLAANALPQRMDFKGALKVDVPIEGGANAPMSGMGTHGHSMAIGANQWTLAGRASMGHDGPPLFSVKRGRTVTIGYVNRTEFPHSMHLHGHHFRLLDRLDDGWKPYWLDTVTVAPRETWRIAFVADNPGKWMLHCHMLEHQDTGMGAWFQVT
jgi:FtsP/CotA-like multicopper oxidase with cupredoxin domain